MDLTEVFHRFANRVADALNEEKVVPENQYSSVIVVVAENEKIPPLGGSLNYIDGKWEVEIQIDQGKPV